MLSGWGNFVRYEGSFRTIMLEISSSKCMRWKKRIHFKKNNIALLWSAQNKVVHNSMIVWPLEFSINSHLKWHVYWRIKVVYLRWSRQLNYKLLRSNELTGMDYMRYIKDCHGFPGRKLVEKSFLSHRQIKNKTRRSFCPTLPAVCRTRKAFLILEFNWKYNKINTRI